MQARKSGEITTLIPYKLIAQFKRSNEDPNAS